MAKAAFRPRLWIDRLWAGEQMASPVCETFSEFQTASLRPGLEPGEAIQGRLAWPLDCFVGFASSQ